ncbi:hypothetical protein [endosymbiont of unidentified scaly snail isolate Monju]|uniref:hypothetical protein n=1 Tax=endosymbiont of unidentified scaly snail isolate Monju TaxID=1248727 RepID=UPI0005BBF177|nr:hypothetical protein [endosymbiont of unidentified scaly snail isolate Monju]
MKLNRYLFFYIILGLGLVTSWTLVGKRARIAPDLGVRIMSVDETCRPLLAPCGAYAQHFALVLGPVGDGHTLRLIGEQLPSDVRLSVLQYDDKAQQLAPPPVQDTGRRHLAARARPRGRARARQPGVW